MGKREPCVCRSIGPAMPKRRPCDVDAAPFVNCASFGGADRCKRPRLDNGDRMSGCDCLESWYRGQLPSKRGDASMILPGLYLAAHEDGGGSEAWLRDHQITHRIRVREFGSLGRVQQAIARRPCDGVTDLLVSLQDDPAADLLSVLPHIWLFLDLAYGTRLGTAPTVFPSAERPTTSAQSAVTTVARSAVLPRTPVKPTVSVIFPKANVASTESPFPPHTMDSTLLPAWTELPLFSQTVVTPLLTGWTELPLFPQSVAGAWTELAATGAWALRLLWTSPSLGRLEVGPPCSPDVSQVRQLPPAVPPRHIGRRSGVPSDVDPTSRWRSRRSLWGGEDDHHHVEEARPSNVHSPPTKGRLTVPMSTTDSVVSGRGPTGRWHGHVVIHCAAGISRSSAALISWLMRRFGWSDVSASAFVRYQRNQIDPNPGFRRQLRRLHWQLMTVRRWRSLARRRARPHLEVVLNHPSAVALTIAFLGPSLSLG